MKYYVVKYTGPFGFIKPWSAVRDGKTFSQQFLTPSIVEGMEKKLFPELLDRSGIHKIMRHKLRYAGMNMQQERTQPLNWEIKGSKNTKTYKRPQSILIRGVMLSPELFLAFSSKDDALTASQQHLCLCRNEDIVLPDSEVLEMEEADFNLMPGFELRFETDRPDSFMVGFNRFADNAPMYGHIEIGGEAVLAPRE